MGFSIGNINGVGQEQLITTYSSGEPNWSYIPSASGSNKSQAEFNAEIKELARKAAMAATKTEQDSVSRQLVQLRTEYLSDVSPDRKSMYQAAKNAIGKRNNSNPQCRGIGELSLLDFLEYAEGYGSFADKRFALAGGGTLTCPALTKGGYGAVIECQGVKILSNTGNGWGYELTPAELAKKDQFFSVYWCEYRAAKSDSGLSELPDYLEEHSTFDAKA